MNKKRDPAHLKAGSLSISFFFCTRETDFTDRFVPRTQELNDHFTSPLLIAAWAAASLAIGTRKGEQDT